MPRRSELPPLQGSCAFLAVSLSLILPVAGWIAGATITGRISAEDEWTSAFVNGVIAQAFAVVLLLSIVINMLVLWHHARNGATYSRRLYLWLGLLDAGGVAWVGGLFLPVEAQTGMGLAGGAFVAVASVGVLVVVSRGYGNMRSRDNLAGPPSTVETSAEAVGRKRRRLVAAGVVAVVLAAGYAVLTFPAASYKDCEINGKSSGGDLYIEVDTTNCCTFALKGTSVAYDSISMEGAYSFRTRGYSLFPLGPKIVSMTRTN